MTDVILNRHGLDHVGFTMTTTGSHVASVTLDKLLLDPTKEYVLRVNELNAPTNGIPLFRRGLPQCAIVCDPKACGGRKHRSI